MKKFLSVISLILLVILIMTGCGNGGLEKKLATSWYFADDDSPIFSLYTDGTCTIPGEYGTGTWVLVNDNQLKVTSYYGESLVLTIESINNGVMTVQVDGETGKLYDSPQ